MAEPLRGSRRSNLASPQAQSGWPSSTALLRLRVGALLAAVAAERVTATPSLAKPRSPHCGQEGPESGDARNGPLTGGKACISSRGERPCEVSSFRSEEGRAGTTIGPQDTRHEQKKHSEKYGWAVAVNHGRQKSVPAQEDDPAVIHHAQRAIDLLRLQYTLGRASSRCAGIGRERGPAAAFSSRRSAEPPFRVGKFSPGRLPRCQPALVLIPDSVCEFHQPGALSLSIRFRPDVAGQLARSAPGSRRSACRLRSNRARPEDLPTRFGPPPAGRLVDLGTEQCPHRFELRSCWSLPPRAAPAIPLPRVRPGPPLGLLQHERCAPPSQAFSPSSNPRTTSSAGPDFSSPPSTCPATDRGRVAEAGKCGPPSRRSSDFRSSVDTTRRNEHRL